MGFWSKIFAANPEQKAMNEASKYIWQIIEDEEFQNNMLADTFTDSRKRGAAIDVVPNAVGPFGRAVTNPIPVNGVLGEIAYLSRLEFEAGGNLLFHRLGAINTIDVYETVSRNGREWDFLYLDPYHPRKSKLAPTGFRIGPPRQFSGFHDFCANFPYDFDDSKSSTPDILRLAYIPREPIRQLLREHSFDRPASHATRLAKVRATLTSFMNAEGITFFRAAQ